MSSGAVEVLPTHTPLLFAEAVARATERLRAGEVVALPTETVYGLAANALNPAAVARIFQLKGRPANNPIIVHVASRAQAVDCSDPWPSLADRLGAAFWPGPLTLVVRKARQIPDLVTAGGPTVGLRWPQHPFMQAVIRACGFPLAAPSANPSNQLSPTRASHVVHSMGDRLKLIVDGGDANVGLESTVVDVSGPAFRILRPGMIDAGALAQAAGRPPEATAPCPDATRTLPSPGLLAKHYSPRARLRILSWKSEAELLGELRKMGAAPATTWILAYSQVPVSGAIPHVCVIPDDPSAYARALYGELHRCDEGGAEWVIVETPPDEPAWAAIGDRLHRAAA